MNTVLNAVSTKVKANFDFTQVNDPEVLKMLQKELTKRKKEIVPVKQVNPDKEVRKIVAKHIMQQLLGMNKAYNVLNSIYNKENSTITTDKGTFDLMQLGIYNKERFEFLMRRLANLLPFIPKSVVKLTPENLLERVTKLCEHDEAKFSELQRAGLKARAK